MNDRDRLAWSSIILAAAVALSGCKSSGDDGGGGAGGGAGGEPATTSSSAGGADPGSGGADPGAGGAGEGGELPASFLPIPDEEGVVRIAVEGGGWTGYDRTCGSVIDADSYYSVSFGNAYVFYDGAGCADDEANASLVQLFREGGLHQGGLFPIAEGGPNIGKVAVSPAGLPFPESELDGEAYVEELAVGDDDTLIAATWYGTTRWRDSEEDPDSEADVTVQVAMRIRVRNVDVP